MIIYEKYRYVTNLYQNYAQTATNEKNMRNGQRASRTLGRGGYALRRVGGSGSSVIPRLLVPSRTADKRGVKD